MSSLSVRDQVSYLEQEAELSGVQPQCCLIRINIQQRAAVKHS
jgi:hypothetical protein